MKFDIVIVGGGIAGASVGAMLADSSRVLIAEAESQCGYHSTGRSAAFFLESYGGPEVSRLNAASYPFLVGEPNYLRARGALHISDGARVSLPPEVRTIPLGRADLEKRLPGVRARWRSAVEEPGCADIDVARLHADLLRAFRSSGGTVRTGLRLESAERRNRRWQLAFAGGATAEATVVVDAAGAWADEVATRCGFPSLQIQPKRRTMVQLRVGKSGLRELPLVIDAAERFYFKGEGDRTIWLSPHDETDCPPCDAAPEEIDVAAAIERFENVVDWPVEAVERKWAGLRSFAPDRRPVYGFDPDGAGFFWCAGQGGFGIQSCIAAGRLCAALIEGSTPHPSLSGIDPAAFAPDRFRHS